MVKLVFHLKPSLAQLTLQKLKFKIKELLLIKIIELLI